MDFFSRKNHLAHFFKLHVSSRNALRIFTLRPSFCCGAELETDGAGDGAGPVLRGEIGREGFASGMRGTGIRE